MKMPVHIIAVGPFGEAVAESLRSLLPEVSESRPSEAGLTSPATWPIAGMHVLAAWRPAPKLTALLNEMCFAWRVPAMTAVMDGPRLRVGPVVVPGAGACFLCAQRRMLQHSPSAAVQSALLSHYDAHPESGPAGYLHPVAEIAAVRIAQSVLEAGRDPAAVAGKIWWFHTLTRNVQVAFATGVHGCPACGMQRDEGLRSTAQLRAALQELWTK